MKSKALAHGIPGTDRDCMPRTGAQHSHINADTPVAECPAQCGSIFPLSWSPQAYPGAGETKVLNFELYSASQGPDNYAQSTEERL